MALWFRKTWRAIDRDTKKDLGFSFENQTEAADYYKRTGANVVKTNLLTKTITVHIAPELHMAGHIQPQENPTWLTRTR